MRVGLKKGANFPPYFDQHFDRSKKCIFVSSSDGEAVASLHREGSNLSAASVRFYIDF